jgi:DNA-binding NarL/FixJ family response regulator
MKKSRIILADDHEFLVEGLLSILKEQSSFEVVATAHNGVALIDAVLQHRPDLVILDMNMPGYDGLHCLDRIKTDLPKTKVLVLTNYNKSELVNEVKKRKAEGYLIKNSSAGELIEVISKILGGQTHFPASSQLKTIPEDSFFMDDFLKKYQLTKREVEIIRLVCQELSNREIADKLFLSELTIRTHRRNILRKLDIRNVAGLVNFAKENQLL